MINDYVCGEKKMKKLLALSLFVVISACTSTSGAPSTSTISQGIATDTLLPMLTITESVSPTEFLTPTEIILPESTPTLTSIPDEIREAILQAYKVLLFIQVNTNLLEETAAKVNAGELTGFDSFGALVAVMAFIKGVDDFIPQITPPDLIKSYWDQAVFIHKEIKGLGGRWFEKEIDSTIVLEEIQPYLLQIDRIMTDLDNDLASHYGFEAKELQQIREEAIQSVNEVFVTPTP